MLQEQLQLKLRQLLQDSAKRLELAGHEQALIIHLAHISPKARNVPNICETSFWQQAGACTSCAELCAASFEDPRYFLSERDINIHPADASPSDIYQRNYSCTLRQRFIVAAAAITGRVRLLSTLLGAASPEAGAEAARIPASGVEASKQSQDHHAIQLCTTNASSKCASVLTCDSLTGSLVRQLRHFACMSGDEATFQFLHELRPREQPKKNTQSSNAQDSIHRPDVARDSYGRVRLGCIDAMTSVAGGNVSIAQQVFEQMGWLAPTVEESKQAPSVIPPTPLPPPQDFLSRLASCVAPIKPQDMSLVSPANYLLYSTLREGCFTLAFGQSLEMVRLVRAVASRYEFVCKAEALLECAALPTPDLLQFILSSSDEFRSVFAGDPTHTLPKFWRDLLEAICRDGCVESMELMCQTALSSSKKYFDNTGETSLAAAFTRAVRCACFHGRHDMLRCLLHRSTEMKLHDTYQKEVGHFLVYTCSSLDTELGQAQAARALLDFRMMSAGPTLPPGEISAACVTCLSRGGPGPMTVLLPEIEKLASTHPFHTFCGDLSASLRPKMTTWGRKSVATLRAMAANVHWTWVGHIILMVLRTRTDDSHILLQSLTADDLLLGRTRHMPEPSDTFWGGRLTLAGRWALQELLRPRGEGATLMRFILDMPESYASNVVPLPPGYTQLPMPAGLGYTAAQREQLSAEANTKEVCRALAWSGLLDVPELMVGHVTGGAGPALCKHGDTPHAAMLRVPRGRMILARAAAMARGGKLL